MSARTRLFIALASTAVAGYIAVGSVLGRVMGDTSYGQLALFNEVVRIVLDSYVDRIEGPNLDRAMSGANLGLVDSLDGDSAYLDAEEYRAWSQPPKDDSDVGIVLSRRYSFLIVVSTRPGSPAEKGGIRAGDLLKTIDGRHTRSIGVPVGERMLRGAPGSVVKLKVLRANADPIDFSLVRERLTPVPPKARMIEDGTAYLKVGEVLPRTAEDMRTELESVKRSGAVRLVLDLRGAAYGQPADGVKVAELFLKEGVVAKVVGRTVTEKTFTADAGRLAWDRPLAVLLDYGTAGPAEVVAAALLDSGRAALVGTRSFGRAPVQRSVPMPEGGLVLTVAKYVSPKGTPIHGKGVEPSTPVTLPSEEPGQTPADPILDKALEILRAEAKKAA